MGDGQAATQARQASLVEHGRDHAEVLVEHHLLAVAHGKSGGFLSAVLEREQPQRGQRGHLGRLTGREHRPEDPAHPG